MKVQLTLHPQLSRTLASFITLCALLASGIAPRAEAHTVNRPSLKPHRGGTVTVGLFSAPACLDPLKFTSGQNFLLFLQIYDTLVSQDEHGHDMPDLASRWSFSHAGKWLTFSLRHGVRFSNGDRLDASAVKFTLEHDAKWAPLSGRLSPIARVRVLDRYTIRLILPTPSRLILDQLTDHFLGVLDPKAEMAAGDSTCTSPVGSGPFKVTSVGPGFSTVTLVPNSLHSWNPRWFHNRGRPYLSSLVVKTVVDPTTAVSELLAGDLDVYRVLGAQVPRVQHQPDIKLHQFYENQEQNLQFNVSRPPFDSPIVRKAVAEAIDRKALVKVVLGGLGRPSYSIFPALDPLYDKRSGHYAPAYRPADARKIFAAHHVTGPYTLMVYNIPAWPESAEFIQAALAAVGVKINVIVKPGVDAQAAYRRGDFDMLIQPSSGNDPYSAFHSSLIGLPGTFNFGNYRSSALDRLLVQNRETVNPKKASAIAVRLQRFINRNVMADPLFSRLITMAARSRVQGWHLNPSNTYPEFRDMYVHK